MKLKLDENLGQRGAALFRAAGHDVATVYEQKMTSATDVELIEALVRNDISGNLWIIRGNRIRVYKPNDLIDENT